MTGPETTPAATRQDDPSAAARRDPERTRGEILDAAIDEFSARGLLGGRIDAIAERTATTKRMIYYYFGSREGLYAAALEDAYRGIRDAERALDLAHLSPPDAIRHLVSFTLDYYHAHPSFVALVVAENQSGGRHIRGLGDHFDVLLG